MKLDFIFRNEKICSDFFRSVLFKLNYPKVTYTCIYSYYKSDEITENNMKNNQIYIFSR
jgi:hypothetical protein